MWLLFQQPDIDEKLSEAPDSGYAIGVLIGSLLPFAILAIAAYLIFRHYKKRMNDPDANQLDKD